MTKAGAQTYFYKFQKETGRVTEKRPSKMDKAKLVYDRMIAEIQCRKDIIAAFVKEIGLTQAGASTYYQNLKKESAIPSKKHRLFSMLSIREFWKFGIPLLP